MGVDASSLPDAGAVSVWPCNVRALRIFLALRTQWRVSMSGPTGLIYAEAWRMMRAFRIRRAKRLSVMGDLQVLESAAIEAWGKRRNG